MEIPLNSRCFAVWSILENDWVVEPGFYELRIGASSRDIRLTGEVTKGGTPVANPYESEVFAPYYSGEVQSVPDESFAALIGRPIPEAKWDRSAPIGYNDAISQGFYLPGGLGKAVYNAVDLCRKCLMALGRKEAGNNVMFVMNMPWRNAGRMSGILNDEQIYGILDIINRKKGGLKKFVDATRRKA